MNYRDDDEIIDYYLKREEIGIRLTAEKYGSRLRSLSLRITNDSRESEECENDTYLKAWDAIPPKEPRGYFFAFLARIVRQLSLDHYKAKHRQKRFAELSEFTKEMEECIPAPDDTESRIDAMALGEILSSFLRELPEERRNMFLRRYWYLDSVKEIAQRFSARESKVKTALFRTRNELREYLGKEGYVL